jgi:hypothetical protein
VKRFAASGYRKGPKDSAKGAKAKAGTVTEELVAGPPMTILST